MVEAAFLLVWRELYGADVSEGDIVGLSYLAGDVVL